MHFSIEFEFISSRTANKNTVTETVNYSLRREDGNFLTLPWNCKYSFMKAEGSEKLYGYDRE